MSTKLFSIFIAAILLTGCQNLSTTTTPAQIKSAAALGSSVALIANPQYRMGMQAGSEVLSQFCATNAPFTVADIQAALAQIQIGGSSAKYVPLYLNDTIELINIFGGNLPSLNSTNQLDVLAQMKTAVCAANEGIQETLLYSAPAVPTILTNKP
jgi:hypothetical protein